jgi:hypothetical protein
MMTGFPWHKGGGDKVMTLGATVVARLVVAMLLTLPKWSFSLAVPIDSAI